MGFWGKLSDDREQQLSLTDHSIDVASVFRALCDLLPAIQRNLGIEAGAVILDRLAVFALLHDRIRAPARPGEMQHRFSGKA